MAWFPGAIRRTISKHRKPMAVYNRVNLHVAVSEASSLYGYFARADVGVVSHFYVRKDGTVEQYVDTAFRAAADLEGNDATISVETQGGKTNAQGEPWTPAQVEALAGIFAWATTVHGIARRVAVDSRLGATSKGLSWHRLGVDPWRVSNGMRYSSSRGKICPGDAKIAQVPAVFTRASALWGAVVPVSNPVTPTPAPTKPKPAPAPSGFVLLRVDGVWGPLTTKALQRVLGVGVDGIFGPITTRALQRVLGVTADGIFGPISKRALQRRLGVGADGIVGPITIRALQRRLNTGKL